MKKHLLATIMLIMCAITIYAQKSKDVLYLKNGSMIYGKLIEITDNQYKIKTSDGSVFIYSIPEVDKFVNEPLKFDGRKESGFGFVLEAGLMIGGQNTSYVAPFSFNYLGNFTTTTKDIFGLGSGVEYIGEPYMPLFFEYKHIMNDKKTSPFIFIRGGNLFHLNGEETHNEYSPQSSYTKSYKGGLTFTFGTGISWAKEDHETYLSFAYRNAHTSFTEKNYYSQTTTYRNTLNRLEIKYGFRF
jgi:hypothetical protein